jgi:transcriptional regulator with XRE-family HTH domain
LPKKICPEIARLVHYRKRILGWSQADLADEMDLSTQAVGGWERGGDCRLSVLKRYAAGLGLDVHIQFINRETHHVVLQTEKQEREVQESGVAS